MKQVGYYHVFPFQEIEKGSKIVLWGMGEVGQHYWKQILQTGYCQVEFAVDKNWQKHKDSVIRVMPIFHVRQTPEDVRIVIANGSAETVKEIRKQLEDWDIPEKRIVWNDLVIGEAMVVGDKITKEAPKVKRVGYYHIFPFHRVERDERILLWGMGEVGRHYALQLQKTGFAQVEFAVDSKWQGVKNAPVEVRAPRSLSQTEKIRVVIANGSSATVESIREELAKFGVGEDRILWEDLIVESELVVQEKLQAQKNGTPYLWGSESGVLKRLHPNRFANILLQYDVISFSVFDAAVFQIKNRAWLYALVGNKLGIPGFSELRIEAEKTAIREMNVEMGSSEVALEDIYRVICREVDIDIKKGCQTELETEIDFCLPNDYLMEVYQILRGLGKPVLFIEDTYYHAKELERILLKFGYDGADRIISSCDCLATKKDGDLYHLEKNLYDKKLRLAHVGSNGVVDWKKSTACGVNGVLYSDIHSVGQKYRTLRRHSRVGAPYSLIVNRHLHQDFQVYSKPYEYGFIAGGILTYGFVKWIQRHVGRQKIDKVLFLSSDHQGVSQIFNMTDGVIPAENAYWSEQVGIRLSARQNRYAFIKKLLRDIPWDKSALKVQTYLDMLQLGSLAEYAEEYKIHPLQNMSERIVGAVERLFRDKWEEILSVYANEGEIAKTYYQRIIGDASRIAIVDINGYGAYASELSMILRDTWGLPCEVDILALGERRPSIYLDTLKPCDNVYSYIFDEEYSCNLKAVHFSESRGVSRYLYFLLMFQSRIPNLLGYYKESDKIRFRFGVPLAENYDVLNQIWKGIHDFCREYMEYTSGYEELQRISGYDAYLPFSRISACPEYYADFAGDFRFFTNPLVSWDGTYDVTSRTLR